MCGRYTLTQSPAAIAAAFGLDLAEMPDLEPRYNIAPSQRVPVVLVDPETHQRQLRLLQWGLVPSWAKDPKIGARLINARAETIAEKPSFRHAFKRRRCLVVADGFYEWQQTGKQKQPFYLRERQGAVFGFAGLWEHWQGGTGAGIDSCTILTTAATETLRPLHDRMPVILPPQAYDRWLNRDQTATELQSLLHLDSPPELIVYPVSPLVNSPAHDQPECIQKLE